MAGSAGDESEAGHGLRGVLRERPFLLFAGSRFFSVAAMMLVNAAVAWHVFEISRSAFHLGMLGLARLVPSLVLTLVGGSVADTYDRRRIVIAAQAVALACSAGLWAGTGRDSLVLVFLLVVAMSAAAAFENPSRQALLPLLVPRALFPRAVTAASAIAQLGFVSGPAVAGAVIAVSGVGAAYAAHAGLVAGSLALLAFMRPRQAETVRAGISVAAIREGVTFVARRQVLLGVMVLDLFAVIFGGAAALLPIYANEILGVGATGYGLLTASAEAGALVMSIILVVARPIRHAGRALLVTVAVYGLATAAFGLSRSFGLSLIAYAATGMADEVSVVLRHTTIQLATPDELRGRVSSVNTLFIGASNQLAAVESGLVAAITSATFAVVSGGIGCLLVVAAVALRMPELRRYRTGAPAAVGVGPGRPVAAHAGGGEGGPG